MRRQMLDAAGVDYRAMKPKVDEEAVKARLNDAGQIGANSPPPRRQHRRQTRGPSAAIAWSAFTAGCSTSRATVTRRRIICASLRQNDVADQRGRPGANGGKLDWHHVETARLQVRPLSEAFIGDYLDAEWPEVGYTVGVFRLEARGVQLSRSIDGAYFTILGMPLVQLLGALRERGLLLA